MDRELIAGMLIVVGLVGGPLAFALLIRAATAERHAMDRRVRAALWGDAADAPLPSSRRAVAWLLMLVTCFVLVLGGVALASS